MLPTTMNSHLGNGLMGHVRAVAAMLHCTFSIWHQDESLGSAMLCTCGDMRMMLGMLGLEYLAYQSG
jgi:hypothetical protein